MAESVRLMIRDSFTGPTGKTPAAVAQIVLDAIRAGRFWIITHADENGAVAARYTNILASIPAAPEA
jgi:hypothetical protein